MGKQGAFQNWPVGRAARSCLGWGWRESRCCCRTWRWTPCGGCFSVTLSLGLVTWPETTFGQINLKSDTCTTTSYLFSSFCDLVGTKRYCRGFPQPLKASTTKGKKVQFSKHEQETEDLSEVCKMPRGGRSSRRSPSSSRSRSSSRSSSSGGRDVGVHETQDELVQDEVSLKLEFPSKKIFGNK